MSRVQVVDRNFDLGFQRDISRDQLPRGAAWTLRDWIPQNGAPLRKRGGWTWGSPDLGGSFGIAEVQYVPLGIIGHLLALRSDGNLYVAEARPSAPAAGTHAGFTDTRGQMFWHRDRMILLDLGTPTASAPVQYRNTGGVTFAVSSLGGSPPTAFVGASWGDYLVLASGWGQFNRIWYSAPGDPESWSVGAGGSWLDLPVTGVIAIAVLNNFKMVFSSNQVWVITGDAPPPGGNLSVRILFDRNGTPDGRSVARYREYVVWANSTGVYRSDGSTLTDLTESGGISRFWREVVSGFSSGLGWTVAGEVFRGHYFVTITNASGVSTTLVCDLDRQVWFELTNVSASSYAVRTPDWEEEELFFGHRTLPRVGTLSPIWTPSASDADGTPVLPLVDLSFHKLGSPSRKRFRRAYVTYDLRGGEMVVEKVLSPENGSYASSGALGGTTKTQRSPVDLRSASEGIGLRLRQTSPSTDTSLHEIEIEGHAKDPRR
jgi:hypothetical protein